MFNDRGNRDSAPSHIMSVPPMASQKPNMQPEGKVRFWYRDNFFITNDKSYLDPQAVNKSLDDLWWSSPLEPGQIQKVLNNCLTLGIYWVDQTEAEMRGLYTIE